mgnify:CR=1 FL=1
MMKLKQLMRKKLQLIMVLIVFSMFFSFVGAACSDTDGSEPHSGCYNPIENYQGAYIKGTTTGPMHTNTDYCGAGDILVEFCCDGSGDSYGYYAECDLAIPGSTCVDGACTCPVDSPEGTYCFGENCGNGECAGSETPSNCPEDCGSAGPVCGDGVCEGGETSASCPEDCGPAEPEPVCGDGVCEDGETSASCPEDCGAAAPEAPNPEIYTPEECTLDTPANGELVNESRKMGSCDNVGSWFCDVQERTSKWLPNDIYPGYNITALKNLTELHQEYLPEESDETITEIGCCPSSWCWNGTGCMNSDEWYSNPHEGPLMNFSECGYRCINGTYGGEHGENASWQFSCNKTRWDKFDSGYCNFARECFVSKTVQPYCIKSGKYVDHEGQQPNQWGNHFCLNGTWTTRTVMVGLEMLEFVSDEPGLAPDRFTLFCDNISRAANNPLNPVTDLNYMCVLQYFDGNDPPSEGNRHVVMGAPLEEDFDVAEFAEEIGTECSSVSESDEYAECEGSNGKYWFNNATNSVIYNKKSSINLGEKTWLDYFADWYSNPFSMLNNAIYGLFTGAESFSEFNTYSGLIEGHTNINSYYIARHNEYSVTAYIDKLYDHDSEELKDFMFINYTGFSDEICMAIEDTVGAEYPYYLLYEDINPGGLHSGSTKCFGVPESDVVTDVDDDSEFTRLWKFLTARLRIHNGVEVDYDPVNDEETLQANLSGQVTDANTGAVVEGVLIELEMLGTYTDDEGHYQFNGLSPGGKDLTLSKSGYETKDVTTDVDTGENTLDVVLVPEGLPQGNILVEVTNTSGTELQNAQVVSEDCGLSDSTSSAGSVEFTDVEAETCEVNVSKSGYYSFYTSTVNIQDGSTASVDAELEPIPPDTGTLSGFVLDSESGDTIASANVLLYNNSWQDTDVTGEAGEFGFSSLATGQYSVNVSKDNYYVNNSEVDIVVGENQHSVNLMQLLPPIGNILVNATNMSGAPVTGASVVSQECGLSASTDSSGIVQFADVEAETCDINVSAVDYYDYYNESVAIINDSTVNVSADMVSLDAPDAGPFYGTVFDAATGDVIESANVTAGDLSNLTDSGGFYTMSGFLVGEITVNVTADGFESNETTYVLETGSGNELNFYLEHRTGDISGQVINSFNGSIVSGADIIFSDLIGDTWFSSSNSQGNYEFESVRYGEVTYSVDHQDYLLNDTAVYDLQSSSASYDVMLEPKYGNVSGYVFDSSTDQPIEGANVTASMEDEGQSSNITNDDGYYFFYEVPAKEVDIEVKKDGYVTQTYTKTVSPGYNNWNFTLGADGGGGT